MYICVSKYVFMYNFIEVVQLTYMHSICKFLIIVTYIHKYILYIHIYIHTPISER